jgi:hypothetical protein
MSEIIMKLLIERLQMTHNLMLKATEEITEEQFAWQPSKTAPPIGWHLWHVGRWADRLQASFPVEGAEKDNTPDPNSGIWETENMASQFGFHIFHAARHLGMVEALRGVLKLKGSATVDAL